MGLNKIRPFIFLTLISTLALALAFLWNSDTVLQRQHSINPSPPVNTYLTNIRSVEYEQSGQLKGTPEAPKVQYYSNQNRAELIAPRYYFHDDKGEGWSVTSAQGRFLDKQGLLFLEGNVVLTNHQNGNHLDTEAMQVNLRDNIASSNILVTVTQGANTISALGMITNLDKEQISMKQNVESTYVPTTP